MLNLRMPRSVPYTRLSIQFVVLQARNNDRSHNLQKSTHLLHCRPICVRVQAMQGYDGASYDGCDLVVQCLPRVRDPDDENGLGVLVESVASQRLRDLPQRKQST